MIKTTLLNGITTERDKDYTALGLSILEAGVVSGLEVTTNQVANGVAFIKVTRTATTPTEEILVKLEITTNEVIDTSGTKKVWLEINQNNINDPGLNDANGTTAGSIQTGANYPAGNYIPLADITGGVITDEREFIKLKLLRKWLTPNSIFYTDTNGVEKELALGTAGQVLSSQWVDQPPIFISPSIDIVWLSEKTNIVWEDLLILSDSEDAWNNKNIKSNIFQSTKIFWIAGENINKWDSVCIPSWFDENITQYNYNNNTNNIEGWINRTHGQTVNVSNIDIINAIKLRFFASTADNHTRVVNIYDTPGGTLLGSKSVTRYFGSWEQVILDTTFDTPINISAYDNIYIYLTKSSVNIGFWYNTTDVYAWWTRYFNWSPASGDLYFWVLGTRLNDGKVFKTNASSLWTSDFIWFANNDALIDEKITINSKGLDDWQTWLTAGSYYFLSDTPWIIATTPWTNVFSVWKAISPTQILIDTNEINWQLTTTATTWSVVLWNAQGYINVNINWTPKKIPYYWV